MAGRPDPQQAHVIAERRRRVGRMYLGRMTQAEIAAKIGVKRTTVTKDLKAVHAEWEADRIGDRGQWITRELAAIDKLERIYMRAWLRSCKDAEIRTAKTIKNPEGGTRQEASKREEGQGGDPRFLEGVRWCINRRIELIGLNAPTKTEHSGPGGAPIAVTLTSEEKDVIRQRILSRLGHRDRKHAGDGPGEPSGPPVAGPDANDDAGWLDT